jgi:hypothetical protein
MALVFAACGGSRPPPSGTVALGAPCRGIAECAPVAGKVVRCDCTDQSKSPLCVADREAGESCATTGNFSPTCRAGTDCSGSLSAPVCVARVATGAACGGDNGLCQDPDYCDASGHCAPGQAKLGEPCDFPEDASCAAPNLCDIGGCVAPAALGKDCIPGDRNPCAPGTVCIDLKCAAPLADGADCFSDTDCSSGVCSLNQCGRGSLPATLTYSCGLP